MGIRIMVADDDPDIVQGLSERLRWLGHDVVTAADGPAALSAVESHAVDLAILDVGMPYLSGIETLRRIRMRWPNLPVVILTAYSSIQLAVEAMREGAIDFVAKPFDAGQLESVVNKAMERSELKTEMTQLLGEISHDVKNMLMPLVAGTDLLEEEMEDVFAKLPEIGSLRTKESHEVCDEVIRLLRSSSQRIHGRMKEIADYVALSRAPREFALCRIDKIAEAVVRSLRVLAEQQRIALELEGLEALPPIIADENRLYSALFNLVHNAIHEVPAGGSITIRGSRQASGDGIELAIQDTGSGMPPEVRDTLFTASKVSRKVGGTGLGTKIVKDVIDSHGGQITVESQEGRGTTFRIRLPVQPPVCAPFPPKPARPGAAQSALL